MLEIDALGEKKNQVNSRVTASKLHITTKLKD